MQAASVTAATSSRRARGGNGVVKLAENGLRGGPRAVLGVGPAGRVAEVTHEGAPGLAERYPFLALVHLDGDRDPGDAADAVARPVVQRSQQQVAAG
jgi:hypothetical protein